MHEQRSRFRLGTGSGDGGACGRADRADVRIKRARTQVNAAVQLPRQEDASQEERHEEKPL